MTWPLAVVLGLGAVLDWRYRRVDPYLYLLVVVFTLSTWPIWFHGIVEAVVGVAVGLGVTRLAGLPGGDMKWCGVIGLMAGPLVVALGLAATFSVVSLFYRSERIVGAPFLTVLTPHVVLIVWLVG